MIAVPEIAPTKIVYKDRIVPIPFWLLYEQELPTIKGDQWKDVFAWGKASFISLQSCNARIIEIGEIQNASASKTYGN